MSNRRNFLYQVLKQEHGFSLLQVLMLTGAISGLVYLGQNLSQQQQKEIRQLHLNVKAEYFQKEIELIMQSEENCTASLSSIRIGNSSILKKLVQVLDGETQVNRYEVSSDYSFGDNDIKIDGYGLEASSKGEGAVHLLVEFSAKEKSDIKKFKKVIPLKASLRDGDSVMSCRYLYRDSEDERELDTDPSGALYIRSKNFGINVKEPNYALDLKGVLIFEPSELGDCTVSNRGTLRLDKMDFALKICDIGSRWGHFINPTPSLLNSAKFDVSANPGRSEAVKMDRYRKCFLSMARVDNDGGSCELIQNTVVQTSWSLTATAVNSFRRIQCGAICYE